jgi:hypothetical protein
VGEALAVPTPVMSMAATAGAVQQTHIMTFLARIFFPFNGESVPLTLKRRAPEQAGSPGKGKADCKVRLHTAQMVIK